MEAYIYHNVDKSKLKQLQSFCWCEFEKPIVAATVEYNKKGKKGKRPGILMLTRGSIYIFKNKILQKELKSPIMYHLLDAKVLHVTPKRLIIDFDSFELKLKTEHADRIARPMLYILRSCTYGLPSLQTMRLDNSQCPHCQDIVIDHRPEDALKWRALFLAHFYNIQGMQLYTMDYFKKYEAKQTPMILIGPSLHPGNFAAAFGHAIAWESLISIVCFQSFAPTKFPMFFDSLVDNARKIKRMAFTDYHNPKRIPQFSGSKLSHSSIVQYNFYRILLPVVLNFLEKCKFIPQIEVLSIHKIEEINAEEFNQLADLAEANEALQSTLRYFEFCRTQVKNFPAQRFTSMFNAFEKLESVAIRFVNGDLHRLLNAISNTTTAIKVIHVNYMPSKYDLSDITLPPSLVHLDLSFCNFVDTSLLSLFKLITKEPRQNQLMVQLLKIETGENFYGLLPSLDLAQCHPNICEFNYSCNHLPNEPSLSLFAFLFAQKNLRLVSFNHMILDSPVDFLKNVLTLITNMQLPGIEVSGNFDQVTLIQFISALSTMNLTFLRRVGFTENKCGSQGLGAMNSLVNSLPNLCELAADGFEPELPALQAFWTTVVNHPSIVATDLPACDAKHIMSTMKALPSEAKSVIEKIQAKQRISTCGKKDEVMLRHFRNNEPVDFSPNIFIEAANLHDFDETDNDFATIELETGKLRSQHSNDQ
ncbi:hypothetical protein TRFO_36212 [Tritrichomonas foetus]|uniref:Uncharacterized protein n=1 Tax=Tritrichomonas foetus TaxID=1144522 RepID=A0A1J4JED6_9EUKA|nr:hypothetical protein TRFO_36212 [Tritrichomonas foetus]|eukprot:OHS97558.1 hypothetical protein TRFO_36212 [Tritrichomonas foetus]